jgi:translocation and assembly module TamB
VARHRFRLPARVWLGSVLALLALPGLLAASLLLAAHTDTGRRLVAWGVGEISGGAVQVEGLSGLLSGSPRASELELHDPEGPWLRLEDVALDLDLWPLLRGEALVASVSASAVALLRLPPAAGTSAGPLAVPLPVRLDRLAVAALRLDPVLPGAPGLALEGSARADRDGQLQAELTAHAPGRADRYRLALETEAWRALSLTVDATEDPGGLLAALGAHYGWQPPPELAAWRVDASARGPLEALALALVAEAGPARATAEGRLDLVAMSATALRGRAEAPAMTLHRSGGAPLGWKNLTLEGDVSGPIKAPAWSGRLALAGFESGGLGLDRVALTAAGTGTSPVVVEQMEVDARGETLRLLAPATLDLADGVAVDRLRLGLRQGAIEVRGRVAPALAAEVTLADLPAELLRPALPDLPLAGTLGAELRLAGTLAAPTGSLQAQGRGLRLTEGAGRSAPPAEVRLSADLDPAGTRIELRGEAGPDARIGLTGRVGGRLPFAPESLDLRAEGRLDLVLLDPLLTAGGRRLAGQATLDARITGRLAAPRLDGALRLAEGGYWDRSLGLALSRLRGRLTLAGDTLRVESLEAQAGPGTLALQGTVGLLVPGVPVDLRLTARDARPLQRDELDLQGDAELRLTGRAAERVTADGTVRLARVDIRLPERLPASIATLDVREKGQRRAPRPGAAGTAPRRLDLGLDLVLSAPRQVLVQGRGIDAELGGDLRVQGTVQAPVVSGGFGLLRGQFNLAGQVLRFSRGRVAFDGTAALDPRLDLEARTTAGGGTAILAVRGTASAPRIELRGEPEMPQDEVLSRLLFGVAGGRLNPWQATRLGLAAASLAGARGGEGGADPLARVGRGLGLSRLGLVPGESGEAALEGGRDLGERAYLGARQSIRTGEPQGVLRFEASRQIRLEADVSPIDGARAGVAFEHEF